MTLCQVLFGTYFHMQKVKNWGWGAMAPLAPCICYRIYITKQIWLPHSTYISHGGVAIWAHRCNISACMYQNTTTCSSISPVLPLVTYTKNITNVCAHMWTHIWALPTAQQWVSMCIRLICVHIDHLEVLAGIEME